MRTTTDSEIKEVIQILLDHLLQCPSKDKWLIAEDIVLDRKNFTVSFQIRFGEEPVTKGGSEDIEVDLAALRPLQRALDTDDVRVTALRKAAKGPRLRITYYNVFRDLKELVH